MSFTLVSQYVDLCLRIHQKPDNYTKENVKRNNRLVLQLISVAKKISQSPDSSKLFYELLNSPETTVRVSAATNCLKYGYHIDRAIQILEETACGDDPIAAFGAEMALKVWKGEVDGKGL